MSELSPAARSVFESFNSKFDWIEDGVPGPQLKAIAAALRAAADQVVPEHVNPVGDLHDEARQDQWIRIRCKILSIATELEAQYSIPLTTMTNYKQLCADLVAWAEKTSAHYYSEPGVLIRARAALAETEPEGPTDEEIMALMPQQMHEDLVYAVQAIAEQAGTDSTRAKGAMRIIFNRHSVDLARAVLARWGNHPGSPDSSTLQPVPITEHLPEPEDCNDEGEVWAWRRFDFEGCMDNGDFWRLAYHKWLEGEDCGFTHWLPAHALPLPTHD